MSKKSVLSPTNSYLLCSKLLMHNFSNKSPNLIVVISNQKHNVSTKGMISELKQFKTFFFKFYLKEKKLSLSMHIIAVFLIV